jgi:hypothetical protein
MPSAVLSRDQLHLTLMVIVQAAEAGSASAPRATISDFGTAIRGLNPYVHRATDGRLALSPPSSLARLIVPSVLSPLCRSLEVTNRKIRRGELIGAAGGRVYDPTNVGPVVQRPWTGVITEWWGQQHCYDELWTQEIRAGMEVRAGVRVLFATLSSPSGIGAVGRGVAAGVQAEGIAVIDLVDHGNGIVISHPWVGPVWITGQ